MQTAALVFIGTFLGAALVLGGFVWGCEFAYRHLRRRIRRGEDGQ